MYLRDLLKLESDFQRGCVKHLQLLLEKQKIKNTKNQLLHLITNLKLDLIESTEGSE